MAPMISSRAPTLAPITSDSSCSSIGRFEYDHGEKSGRCGGRIQARRHSSRNAIPNPIEGRSSCKSVKSCADFDLTDLLSWFEIHLIGHSICPPFGVDYVQPTVSSVVPIGLRP